MLKINSRELMCTESHVCRQVVNTFKDFYSYCFMLVMVLPRLHKAANDGNTELVREFCNDDINEKAGRMGNMFIDLKL